MGSFVTVLYHFAIFVTLIYAIFSVYLNKSLGLFIAAFFHVILGIASLPSIGLYVIGIAIIEIIFGIVMILKK